MFEKRTRPFTSGEIEQLRRRVDRPTLEHFHNHVPRSAYAVFGAALGCTAKLAIYIVGFAIAFVAGAFIQEVLNVRHGWLITLLVGWICCFLVIRIINIRLLQRFTAEIKAALREAREILEKELAKGNAVAWHFTDVRDATRIEYGEDLGYTLMMDAGDGHILCVSQEFGFDSFDDPEEFLGDSTADFDLADRLELLPNSEFEIVHTSLNNILLDVNLRGEPFFPAQEIEFPFDAPSAKEHFLNLNDNRVALLPGRLDSVRENLQNWLDTELNPRKLLFFVVG